MARGIGEDFPEEVDFEMGLEGRVRINRAEKEGTSKTND